MTSGNVGVSEQGNGTGPVWTLAFPITAINTFIGNRKSKRYGESTRLKIPKVGMSYFIQRGTTVKGPFSQAKLKTLVEEKKLKQSDSISESADGPWEPLSTAYGRIRNSAQSRTLPLIPTIEKWSVKRGWLGKYKIKFVCPQCSIELNSNESDIGQSDYCPQCGCEFVLSSSVIEDISSDRQGRYEKEERKSEEKQQRLLERQQEREQKQQLKENQRLQAEQVRLKELARQQKLHEQMREQEQAEDEIVRTSTPGTASSDSIATDWTGGQTEACWYCTQPHSQSLQCPFCRMIS